MGEAIPTTIAGVERAESWTAILATHRGSVEGLPMWKKRIEGTPLENDIPVQAASITVAMLDKQRRANIDPRRRAPIVGEMYLDQHGAVRWVVEIMNAYGIGKTWIIASVRGGTTNEIERHRMQIELPEWEKWVREGGELIGWKQPIETPDTDPTTKGA